MALAEARLDEKPDGQSSDGGNGAVVLKVGFALAALWPTLREYPI
jgi:hypothetical protein